MTQDDMLYPLLYVDDKKAEKTYDYSPLRRLRFVAGPKFDVPYCDVTEHEGRFLVTKFPGVFAWPTGTKLPSSTAELEAKVNQLEARINQLEKSQTNDAPKRGRKAVEAA